MTGSFLFDTIDIQRDWPWISKTLHCHLVEDTGGFIAFDGQGQPVATAVFDSFTQTACTCHIAVLNPLVIRHGFLQMVAKGIFVFGKRRVLIGITPSDNAKALRFNARLGWTEIYRIRGGYRPDVDLVVQEMRRETCRWLSEEDRHGQESAGSTRPLSISAGVGASG